MKANRTDIRRRALGGPVLGAWRILTPNDLMRLATFNLVGRGCCRALPGPWTGWLGRSLAPPGTAGSWRAALAVLLISLAALPAVHAWCGPSVTTVSEDAGTVQVVVSRWPADARATADFYTVDGRVGYEVITDGIPRTARAGSDFLPRRGSVTFEAGQGEAAVTIPLLDNGIVDGARYFTLVVTNYSLGGDSPGGGAGLGEYQVRIEDNEVNPLLDSSFEPAAIQGSMSVSDDAWMNPLVPLPDGTIVGSARTRLEANGSVDFGFKPPLHRDFALIGALPDGRVWVVDWVLGRPTRLVRLRRNGDVELEVTVANLVAATPVPDGGLYALSYRESAGPGLLRHVLPDGSLDPAFDEAVIEFEGLQGGGFLGYPHSSLLVAQSDGRVLLLDSNFRRINSEPRRFLAGFNRDGSLDHVLLPGLTNAFIQSSLEQPDGRLLLAGSFAWGELDGAPPTHEGVIRVNSDGSLDRGFNSPPFRGTIALSSAGLWGMLDLSQGLVVVHLREDGSIDPTLQVEFNMNGHSCAGQLMPTLTVTPQGQALVGGDFRTLPGLSSPAGLIRIRLDAPPRQFRVVQSQRYYRSADTVRLQIVRSGDTTQPASVSFATRDGSARAGEDYEPVAGPLSFAPLEVAKEISVPLSALLDPEPRHFLMELSDPSAGYVTTPPARIQLAPAPQIVPESLQSGYDDATHHSYVGFAFRHSPPAGYCRIESSADARQWQLVSREAPDSSGPMMRVRFDVPDALGPAEPAVRFFRVVGEEP